MRRSLCMFLALVLLAAFLAVPVGAEGVSLLLMSNKVEIEPALQGFAKTYAEKTGVALTIETYGGGADYAGQLKAKVQADQMPDIFVIEGDGGYQIWKDYCEDLSGEPWVADTDLSYIGDDGKVVGFPVAVEGFGLGYNKDILDKAGIDPATITTYSKMKEAFEKLDSMKAELGLDAVVAMGASVSGGLWWVGQHNFCAYLGGGLDAGDDSIIKLFKQGKVDEARLARYANYVKLLYDFADQEILTNGNYDAQVSSFAQGKTAFIHQGNWIDPNMKQMGVTFPMGYVPHCMDDEQEYTGLFLFPPSFYCVNKNSKNVQAAKDMLAFMASTPEGADYMVNQAGMVPAFKSIALQPAGDFSKALVAAQAKGGNYAVRFGQMPDGFTLDKLAPAYDLFAQDTTQIDAFIADITAAVATMAG